MATVTIGYDIDNKPILREVESIKSLSKAAKEAQDQLLRFERGTKEFDKQSKVVGNLKNEMNDLKKSISSVSGQPIENLTGSFALLSNQVESLDFKGATASLQSLSGTVRQLDFKTLTSGLKDFGKGLLDVGKAIITSPIFLVAAAIGGIIYAIKLWDDNNKLIIKSQEELNKAIEVGVKNQEQYQNSIDDTSLNIDILTGKIDKGAAAIKRIEMARDADRIKVANRTAAAIRESATRLELDLTKAKVVNGKIRFSLDDASNNLELQRRIAFNNEVRKLQEQANKEGIDLQQKFGLLKQEELLKQEAERKAIAERERNERAKEINRVFRQFKEEEAITEALLDEVNLKRIETTLNAEKEFIKNHTDFKISEDKRAFEDKKMLEDELSKREQDEDDAKRSLYANSRAALLSIDELYYNLKVGSLEKGSKKEQEIARQSFNIGKAANLSIAITEGILGVQKAYTVGMSAGPIAAIANAAAAGIVALTNVTKIATAKFQATGSSNIGAGASAGSVPQANVPTPDLLGPQTLVRGNQQLPEPMPQKVFVTERDISNTINRVSVLEDRGSF